MHGDVAYHKCPKFILLQGESNMKKKWSTLGGVSTSQHKKNEVDGLIARNAS